jgi:hypothetical protein
MDFNNSIGRAHAMRPNRWNSLISILALWFTPIVEGFYLKKFEYQVESI